MLQAHARKCHVPIDAVRLDYEVTAFPSGGDILAPPKDGVYIDGITIDAGRWDAGACCLAEPLPGVMAAALPVVHVVPRCIDMQPGLASLAVKYSCPLYKTAGRAGLLSTTGQSNNFVTLMQLPARPGTVEDHWVLQGVALILSCDGG